MHQTPTPNQKDTVTEKLVNCLLRTTLSHAQNFLNSFEDTEAVMKMITKSGSPTMRQASRTQRVASDRLF